MNSTVSAKGTELLKPDNATGRADMRFSIDAAGELYLYSKGDGIIRRVVGAAGF